MPDIPLQPVDAVVMTTLVDNLSDMLLLDEGPAKRPRLGDATAPRAPAGFIQNSVGTRFEL
jgi:hypothetical protein